MYSPERVLVTHETRELFQRSSGRMYCMCSEEMLSAPAASFGLCSQKALAAAQKLHKGTGHWHDKNVCSEKCRNHRNAHIHFRYALIAARLTAHHMHTIHDSALVARRSCAQTIAQAHKACLPACSNKP
jgi:hypothetical protein